MNPTRQQIWLNAALSALSGTMSQQQGSSDVSIASAVDTAARAADAFCVEFDQRFQASEVLPDAPPAA